jgi:hypothetical protein
VCIWFYSDPWIDDSLQFESFPGIDQRDHMSLIRRSLEKIEPDNRRKALLYARGINLLADFSNLLRKIQALFR